MFLVQTIIIKTLGPLLLYIFTCRCFKKQKNESEFQDVAVSDDIYAELSLSSLTEFYKRVTGELNDYKDMVKS